MDLKNLTPTERICLLALRLRPNQTLVELTAYAGAKDVAHLAKSLRTLRMANHVIATTADGITRFAVTEVQQ